MIDQPNLRGQQSPCGRYRLDVREHKLWLITLISSEEWQLTHDGTAELSYGTGRQPMPNEPWWGFVVSWSPDGLFVATQRLDLRGVREHVITEAAPRDGSWPKTHIFRDPFPGDEHVPMATVVIVDTDNGTATVPDLPPIARTHTSPLLRRDTWWNTTGTRFYLVVSSRDWLTLRLVAVDPLTGAVETLIEEQSERRIRPSLEFHQAPCVAVHDNTSGEALEPLWFSERDGWGHLYRYDLATAEATLVTNGDVAIASIHRVDWRARAVWASVAGIIPDDPYRESICRFDLDTGAMDIVAGDNFDHRVIHISADGSWFAESASTVGDPPTVYIRDWTGRVLVQPGQTDISALEATGWRRPERFAAPAAKGKTTVYGTLFYPADFTPSATYPVIDHVYPGPQMHRSVPWFAADDIEPYTALGIVGVTIDGRGTPGRDRAFADE